MVKEKVRVMSKAGLHARPVNTLIKITQHFESKVEIEVEGKLYNAKSLLGVLAAGVDYGDEISIVCTGADEAEACKTVTELIASGMGE